MRINESDDHYRMLYDQKSRFLVPMNGQYSQQAAAARLPSRLLGSAQKQGGTRSGGSIKHSAEYMGFELQNRSERASAKTHSHAVSANPVARVLSVIGTTTGPDESSPSTHTPNSCRVPSRQAEPFKFQ